MWGGQGGRESVVGKAAMRECGGQGSQERVWWARQPGERVVGKSTMRVCGGHCMHATYAAAHTDGMCVRVGRGGVCGGDEGLRGRQRM